MLRRFFLPASLGLWTVSLGVPTADAALVAYDGFAGYADGALAGNNGGTGWSNAWATASGATVNVAANGLSYNAGSITVGGNSQAVSILNDSNSGSVATRQFATITSSEVWFSLLVQPNGADGNDFIQLYVGTNNNFSNSGAVGDLNSNNNNNYWGARIRAGAGDSGTSSSGTALSNGNTTFLVARISTDGTTGAAGTYDKIELWVNPTSTTLGTADAFVDGSLDLATTTGIDWFGIRTVNLDAGDNFIFDEFRVGTTLESVVVPEPGTISLTLALAGALAFRRRR
ncbi:PEP-CTERM sorting domain-containing protein [Luteolibacter sp. SL250]|uniref:PEP-CTERM sorting domain-containing protein n=1 Tax=Luteolibacter sp. SL250 TaxID=2995170 RepID=UPI00226DC6E2|nr:PEP-CTERM sorting domain-containing protein [Luteolibacter sp. SL250]WAC18729.1 PEP-CTERM sorting domain-containing protein [Luteolibacter sp. SL250]